MIFKVCCQKKFKRLLTILFAIVTLVWIFYNISMIRHYKRMNQYLSTVLKSECDCRLSEQIYFTQSSDPFVLDVRSSPNQHILYNISVHSIESAQFTCDLYHTFRRGQHLKVIGYSLYGNKSIYYKFLPSLARAIKKMYPGWIMRVYHDDSINTEVKCKVECLKDENNDNNLIDNAEFCNINKIAKKGVLTKYWNANYMHAMKWRWLPIGDSFVDVFASRDTDSFIIQREVDAVNEWLTVSNKSGHIMRGKFLINIFIGV